MAAKRDRSTYEDSTDSSTSSYALYGRSLPRMDACTRDDGSFVPVWKQEVTDERGRKRLHGAFTGGFSAGYFNTVGSKEGWTPTTFKSSRNMRVQAAQPRPEDYMDFEDLQDIEEARQLGTNTIFSGIGQDGRVPIGTLIDLLMPAVQDTVGYRLLGKMGWKHGEGVGPRNMRRPRVFDDQPGDALQASQAYKFAPKNTDIVSFQRKNNEKGIGYVGEPCVNRSVLHNDNQRDLLPPIKTLVKTKQPSGPAFGVGVLNDDDDEDPYEIRPKSTYNKTISDGSSHKGIIPTLSMSSQGKPIYISKKLRQEKSALSLRKCHDGRLPISGFLLSNSTLDPGVSLYPPPIVPESWERLKQEVQSNIDPTTIHKLDYYSRGEILGEIPLPGKSVFDFLTPNARNRIASMTGNSHLPPGLGQAPISSKGLSPTAGLVPGLDPQIALAALNGGFIPYADDLGKRARYLSFLEVTCGNRTGLPERKYGMNTQDWVKEMNEFVGAARIFKPLAGSMATRFKSSTSSDIQGVSENSMGSTLLSQPATKIGDTAEEAAKISMYGVLTRAVINFSPSRLLSKRFNVRPIDHSPKETAMQNSILMQETLAASETNLDVVQISPNPPCYSSETTIVDSEKNDALEDDKAADEVFQTIFGDDE